MNYWLIKTEAECYSIDDLKRDRRIPWEGVRNYTARNFMMRDMKVGDIALFYHSNTDMGVYGLAKVASKPHPDESALRKGDEHFDPKTTKDKPIWYCVDFAFVKKFKSYLPLGVIKSDKILSGMVIAQKGSRLSITPVSEIQYKRAISLLDK
jgi:predicted RNA-binding protein with PUA-like domain